MPYEIKFALEIDQIVVESRFQSLGAGAHFSRAPETFWVRKAIAKSRLQSYFIQIFLT